MKRLMLGAMVLLAFVVPTAARADTGTYTPGNGYKMGPSGGTVCDAASPCSAAGSPYMVDPSTGDITVFRVIGGTLGGSLGCAGSAGYGYLEVDHVVDSAVNDIKVAVSNPVMDNFTWIKVTASIVGGDGSLATAYVRGLGDGYSPTGMTIDLKPVSPQGETAQPGDTLRIIFGMEVSSSCAPTLNNDGGHATFTSVTVS